ncbi:MAG TPA: hypothetical protein VEF72_21405 [Mycobacterium sp.]|nr:hypothetical protein [Mycobacterium sp.]
MSVAETQMDLDRITHPLRLAKGSHQPGSGKGCAMKVISYITGDAQVTDFPVCSARPLTVLVQSCNDLLAGSDGYLSPENSLLALELAWQTVGTADVSDTVVHAWLAELLANPIWGVVQYAKISATKAIVDIAELHRRAAAGDMPPIVAWDAADRAARAAAQAMNPTANAAGVYAIRAAYESTALVDTRDYQATLDAVTAFAVRAHTRATEGNTVSRIVEVTRQTIRSWRDLAGLDNPVGRPASVKHKVVLKTVFVPSHRRAGTTTIATTGIVRRSSR